MAGSATSPKAQPGDIPARLPRGLAVLPRIEIEVEIEAGRDHHVPLLLSPYACTIYRGS